MKLLKIFSEMRKRSLEEALDVAFELKGDSSLNYRARDRHRVRYNELHNKYFRRYGTAYIPEVRHGKDTRDKS